MLTDDELLAQIVWPEEIARDATAIRRLITAVKRYVDYDGTMAMPGLRPLPSIRGRPLKNFLAEEPYAIQTWNPLEAVAFFERHADLPRPVLIIATPLFIDIDAPPEEEGYGKDLSLLGITDAVIYDDMPPALIRAPGCILLSP